MSTHLNQLEKQHEATRKSLSQQRITTWLQEPLDLQPLFVYYASTPGATARLQAIANLLREFHDILAL